MTTSEPDPLQPTVLWRMQRGSATAYAAILPGSPTVTLTWFIDGVLDRAENYDTLPLAMARADHVQSVLVGDGWVSIDE